ncbi:MAG: hypothetical protein ACHQF0_00985 [Chitinophagales bacterium]
MKISIKKLSVLRISLVITAIVLILFASCSKSKSTDVTFMGTYYGTMGSGLYNESDTIAITAGISSAVTMISRTGIGSSYSINGAVSGASLNIPSQSVYVASLDGTYTVSGSGNLAGSALVINYVFISPTNSTTNWTFTGTRK